MVPWERDTYIGMVNSWAKEEAEKMKQKRMEQEAKMNRLAAKNKLTNKRKR
jgi:hypothetical protein